MRPSSDAGAALGEMMDAYLGRLAREQLAARAAAVARLHTRREVAARQRFIRSTVLKAIGGLPKRRTPLKPVITGALERQGYRVEKLVYQSQPRHYVTANVYVPAGSSGPFPAVLACMGHYEEGKAFEEGQRLFITLARRGFVVLAYDPPDEGERKEYLDTASGKLLLTWCPEAHTMSGLPCLLTGRNFAHYELWDGIRAVDYLVGRPDVDGARIGVVGNSGGGTQASYLAVVERRLAAAAPCCYITSWETLWRDLGPQDAEQNLTDFLKCGLDFPDYAIAFAPKPFTILSAIRDFFPIEGARTTHAEVRRIYGVLGAEERAGYFEYDDGHAWSKPRREATCAWMERWLQGRTDSAPEGETEIEPIEALNCTPTGQVLTSYKAVTVQKLNARAAGRLHVRRRAATAAGRAQLPDMILRRLRLERPAGVPPVTEGDSAMQPHGLEERDAAWRPRLRSDGMEERDAAWRPRLRSDGMEERDAAWRPRLRSDGGRNGCRIERLVAETEPGISVPMLVFSPEGRAAGRLPAVIAVDEAGKGAAAAAGGECERLALAGHVVLAADLRGLGESRTTRPIAVYSDLYDPDMRAILVGKTMAGMQLFDLLSVLAYARSRPDVDPAQISLSGRGTAGVIALFAAALEPRVAGVALIGALGSYREVVGARMHQGVMDLVIPGILEDLDLPDLVEFVGRSKITIS